MRGSIIIKVRGFDLDQILFFKGLLHKLVQREKSLGEEKIILVEGRPAKHRRRFTLLKSAFVNNKARTQLEVLTHSRVWRLRVERLA